LTTGVRNFGVRGIKTPKYIIHQSDWGASLAEQKELIYRIFENFSHFFKPNVFLRLILVIYNVLGAVAL